MATQLEEVLSNTKNDWSEIINDNKKRTDFVNEVKEAALKKDETFQKLQTKMETNLKLKELVIESMLSSYLDLGQEFMRSRRDISLKKQQELTSAYESLFQKKGEPLLETDSAIGTFFDDARNRKFLQETIKNIDPDNFQKEGEKMNKDIDYSRFSLPLLGKMATLSSQIDKDLSEKEGLGSKVQSILYGVAKALLAVVAIVAVVRAAKEELDADVNIVQGNMWKALEGEINAEAEWDLSLYAVSAIKWLEEAEKGSEEKFFAAAGKMETELNKVRHSKDKKEQIQQDEKEQIQKEKKEESGSAPQTSDQKRVKKRDYFLL